MAMNRDLVGKEYPPVAYEVTAEATRNYARAYNDDNPWVLEGIIAPPMYGVVVSWPALGAVISDADLRVDFLRLLHGEQDMTFFQPIRPKDTITSRGKILSIEEKATGETLVVEVNSHNQHGDPVQKLLFTAFVRGKGGAEKKTEKSTVEPDRGEPMLAVRQTIDPDQTYRYAEASGDHNPIHLDKNVARMAGLPGIIVHGLCTMAFTSKVVIDHLCGADPTKLRRLRVRFSRPVFPGQTITTKVWKAGEREGVQTYTYETYIPEDIAVIKDGIAEIGTR